MGVLSGFKKVIRHIKLSDGYKKLSFWTSSETVEMNDGSTLESNRLKWDDKYTKTEIDNKLSAIETNIDWKESVATFPDIMTNYPEPQDGWTVNVKDTDYTYRYNGEEWVVISANAIPKATDSVDGLLCKEDHVKYDDANSKKHTHDNITALDMITPSKIEKWDQSAEGTVNKSGDTMTGALTAPTFFGDLQGTFDGLYKKNVSIGGIGYGWGARGYDGDLNTWIDPGTYASAGNGNCTNYPPVTDGWGSLSVLPSMSDRVVQIFSPWNGAEELYYRSLQADNGWSAWKLMSNHSYALCTDAAATVNKNASSSNICLRQFHRITVYFINGSDAVANPTLNINSSTGAMPICYKGERLDKAIPRGSFIDMIYIDGNFHIIGGVEDVPLASSSVRGGVKTGYTANGKNYPVQLYNEQMYVNVPWTDTNTTYGVATTSANGLMSSGDKSKLDGIGSFLSSNGNFTLSSSNRDTYVSGNTITIPSNSVYIIIARASFNGVGSGGTGHCRLNIYNSTGGVNLATTSNNDTAWCSLNCDVILATSGQQMSICPRMSGSFSTRTGSYQMVAARIK